MYNFRYKFIIAFGISFLGILSAYADYDSDQQTALIQASEKGDLSQVKYLIRKYRLNPNHTVGIQLGWIPRKFKVSPLFMAFASGNPDVVLYLLKHGAKLDQRVIGHRPACGAVLAERNEAIQTLIQSGIPREEFNCDT